VPGSRPIGRGSVYFSGRALRGAYREGCVESAPLFFWPGSSLRWKETTMKSAYSCLLRSVIILACCSLSAATFTVTTTNISGPGSLPVVINQANASPGHNVVEFGVTNALTLAFPLATITNNLTIIGRTDVQTVTSGGGTLPILSFAAGTTNILSQLVLINGNTTGGGAAINNAGTLSVSSCVMSNNTAPDGNGGAVSNAGTMTIADAVFQNNQAANGGAMFCGGNMTITGSLFSNNQAGNGGAVYNTGSLALNSLNISNNIATFGFGGAVYNGGTLMVNSSTLAFNQAAGGAGGSAQELSGGGGGAGLGGGLFSLSGTVSLTNCTFSSNSASGGPGGGTCCGSSAVGGGNNGGAFGSCSSQNGGYGGGGAGATGNGCGSISGGNGGFGGGGGGYHSVQYYGTAGVGGFGGGNAGTNLSIVGTGGGGGAGLGGGIFVEAGSLSIVNCTVSLNHASGGAGGTSDPSVPGDGGQPGEGIGGGIFNHSGVIRLLNTITAGNNATNESPDLYGAFVTTGFNLIVNNQGATGLSINDFQNVPANLGPLQDNGGPTLTCVPQQGSLAIGYGTSVGAPRTDQRGVPRPLVGSCDIGAVQVVAAAPYLVGPVSLGASGFAFEAIFDATNAYRVRASTNMLTWVDATNYSSGGLQHFLDASATNFNRRFYRAVSP